MITFIIVDDEKKYQIQISKILKTIEKNTHNNFNIITLDGNNQKLNEYIKDKSQRKIFLLDIDLEKQGEGIDIALKIREDDWDSEIIFLTNHDNYFKIVYKTIYKVLDFIEKYDHLQERLTTDIMNILSQKYDTKMFHYSTKHISMKLYMKNILYIYRDTIERKVVIVTTSNTFLINSTLSNVLKKLDYRFIKVHRACIVNLQHVEVFKWNKGYFKLDNGKCIDLLSKKYKTSVEEALIRFEKLENNNEIQ